MQPAPLRHGPKFEVMGKWANLNHREYAKRHGYDFFQGDENVLPHMHFLVGRGASLVVGAVGKAYEPPLCCFG